MTASKWVRMSFTEDKMAKHWSIWQNTLEIHSQVLPAIGENVFLVEIVTVCPISPSDKAKTIHAWVDFDPLLRVMIVMRRQHRRKSDSGRL